MDDMIEVRIRFNEDAESKHLCRVPFNGLDHLHTSLCRWGVLLGDGETHHDIYGQFVYEAGDNPHFELVIS